MPWPDRIRLSYIMRPCISGGAGREHILYSVAVDHAPFLFDSSLFLRMGLYLRYVRLFLVALALALALVSWARYSVLEFRYYLKAHRSQQ